MSTADVIPFPTGRAAEPAPAANAVREPTLADFLPPASLPGDPRLVVRHEGVELAFPSEAALRAELNAHAQADDRRRQAALYDAAPWWARVHFAVAGRAGAIAAGGWVAVLAYTLWRIL